MAFNVVKKSSLPAVSTGRVAPTSPAVGVTEVGGVVFNSFISKKFMADHIDRILLMHDADSGKVAVVGIKAGTLPKSVAKEDLFDLCFATKKNAAGEKVADDAQSSLRGVQGWLRMVGYEFKASGNQKFEATTEDKPAKGCYMFNLPKGALTARPKQARKGKADVTTVNGANGAAVPIAAKVQAPPSDDELVLEA